MADKDNILFIINPNAGTGSKKLIDNLILGHLDERLYAPSLVHTEKPKHGFHLAKEYIEKGFKFIVAVGGDGTVNEIASAVIHTDAKLGILPFGSGNGLARHLQIPRKPISAIRLLNHQKHVSIDGGLANDKPFFCTAGIGFDAHVGMLFSQSSRRGFFTYVRTVLKEFVNYKSLKYTICADGKSFEREAFSITFANAGQFGNDAYISPFADIKDGQLDLCIVKKYPKNVGIHLGMRLFYRSMHKSRYVEISKIKEAEVHCPGASCYHLDGEHFELKGSLNIQTVPSCLNVIVP